MTIQTRGPDTGEIETTDCDLDFDERTVATRVEELVLSARWEPTEMGREYLTELRQTEDPNTEDPPVDLIAALEVELHIAEQRAWDSLNRYKFQMFGYWAGIWVHLNRVGGFRRANPWRELVHFSRQHTPNDEHE